MAQDSTADAAHHRVLHLLLPDADHLVCAGDVVESQVFWC